MTNFLDMFYNVDVMTRTRRAIKIHKCGKFVDNMKLSVGLDG